MEVEGNQCTNILTADMMASPGLPLTVLIIKTLTAQSSIVDDHHLGHGMTRQCIFV